MDLKEALKEKIPADKLQFVPRSFDIIGSKEKSVIIIEVPKEMKKYKKLIAQALMGMHKSVTTVLNKVSGRRGKYRLVLYEKLAGSNDTEVLHREYGAVLKLDPKKVFFSPRESTERQRIAAQVRPKENVLVMFSGVAPYPIAIARKQPKVGKIVGVDVNPVGYKYAQDNIRMNKLSDKIQVYKGDVRKVCPKLGMKFDRIMMPLAMTGWKYLDVALKVVKKGGIIHMYYISFEENLFSEPEEKFADAARKSKRKFKILERKRVLPWGSRSWKVCLDVKVN